jgi:hypothetical protein
LPSGIIVGASDFYNYSKPEPISVESMTSLVKSQERMASEEEIRNAFGVPLPELLPKVFDHNLDIGAGSYVSLEDMVRIQGPSSPWLINLVHKVSCPCVCL